MQNIITHEELGILNKRIEILEGIVKKILKAQDLTSKILEQINEEFEIMNKK